MKKITTILMLLMLSMGVWAEDGSITVTSGNAKWTNNDGTYTSNKVWTSNATGKPVVTITGASENNSQAWNTGNGVLMCQKGTDGLLTLTISIAGDYRITGFTFTGQNAAWTNNVAVKFSSNGQDLQGTSNVQMTVTDLNTVSTTITAITLETGERGKITDFVIYYTKLEDYTDNVNTNIKPWIDNGYFTLDPNNTAVQALQTAYNDHTGDTWTEDEYNTLVSLLDAAKASEGAFKMPENGYYRIKNINYGKYIGYGVSGNAGKGSGAALFADTNNPATVIKLTKNGEKYTISSQGQFARQFPTNVNDQLCPMGAEADADEYEFTVVEPGKVVICTQTYPNPNNASVTIGYFHGTSWDGVVSWRNDVVQSYWTVEDAENLELPLTNIDGKYYATTCLPFPVKLSEEAAYKVTISGKKAVEEPIGDVIPANIPVLLISDASTTLTATIQETTATVDCGDLKGVLFKTAKADLQGETPVVLNQKNGKVGFYKLADGSSLSANRAYLSYVEGTTSPSSKAFFEEGFELGGNEATAIENIENGAFENGAVYNLQGQRVTKAQKGVYIINNKKVVVK